MILPLLAAADLLLVNGRIHTLDPARPAAASVLVRGERIVAVGSEAELRAQAGPGARILDLGGRAVIPGLIDTHTHLFDALQGRVAGDLDVGVPAVTSLAAAVATVRARAATTPAGEWILGDGWAESKWPERRLHPQRRPRPGVGRPPRLPGARVRPRGHPQQRGPAPLGHHPDDGAAAGRRDRARARRRAHGRAQGHGHGAGQDEAPPFGPAERLQTAERAGRESAEVGLTTIHNSILPLEDAETYREADAQGRLKVRVLAIPFIPNQGTEAALGRLRALGVKTGDRSGRVTWGGVKFMCDGGMAAKTIAVTPPGTVDDPRNLGLLGWETAELTAAMKAVRDDGLADHRPRDRRSGHHPDPRRPRGRPRTGSRATTEAASSIAG